MNALNYTERILRLETNADCAQRMPWRLCGEVMARTAPLVPYSLRMAIEGASVSRGPRPKWLDRASDVRFVDYDRDGDDTLLVLQSPTLGEAAEELYKQQELWETRPEPTQTGLDLLAKVVSEAGADNAESDWFDRPLLSRLGKLDRLFSERLRAVRLPAVKNGGPVAHEPTLDASVAATARELSKTTPSSRQIRVTGTLDMIRHSTRSFAIRLQDGTEVHGVLDNYGLIEDLTQYFDKKVLVLGAAVYRPSGRLLRIDAHAVESGEGAPAMFEKIPPPMSSRPTPSREKPGQTGKRGVAAFFGSWPGEETVADFESILREVRG